MNWEWPLPTCCFIRNTCSSSAFISLSCTSWREKKKKKEKEHFCLTNHFRCTVCPICCLVVLFLLAALWRRPQMDLQVLLLWSFRAKLQFSSHYPIQMDWMEKTKVDFFFYFSPQEKASRGASTTSAPLTWTLRPSPPLRPTLWTETHTSCVLYICKADPGSSPLSLRYRWGRRHL